METELLTKLVPNAVSAVAVIVVVWMFLKRQKEERDAGHQERAEFIQSMTTIRDECHSLNQNNQKAFQDQMSQTVERVAEIAHGYEEATRTSAGAIAANGVILTEIKNELMNDRRGIGRRLQDWEAKGGTHET